MTPYERFDHGNTRGDPRNMRRPGEARRTALNYSAIFGFLLIVAAAAALAVILFSPVIGTGPGVPDTGATSSLPTTTVP